eukprot:GHVL01032140.1.p1 GENE.GHVL01032140.1~~GHVL01032140.1.p1  ORF type:complete len:331 (-),score=65.67 GHVL01032140.1:997-1989(-)
MNSTSDKQPTEYHDSFPVKEYPSFKVAAHSLIGNRKSQEDRITVVPKLLPNRDDCAFFGVFDGTVGNFASDTIQNIVVSHLLESPHWNEFVENLDSDSSLGGIDSNSSYSSEDAQIERLHNTMNHVYNESDKELIRQCAEIDNHYASCTSVTVLLAGPYICVAHIGDSRVALCSKNAGSFLTVDHKPDDAPEMQRIIESGGSVEYLQNHQNKAFIRGGDFTGRKSKGEQPMQLQYSRAFGGKDLKMFGLSSKPDIRCIKLENENKVENKMIILASDGIWDVVCADYAAKICMNAYEKGQDPSEELAKAALAQHASRRQVADNVTAIVIIL